MRRVLLLIVALLTVAGALGTSMPTAEAVGGGGTPGCSWQCTCSGSLVCTCVAGVTGSCVYPPNIACTQGYNC